MRYSLVFLALLPTAALADEPPLAIRNAAVETLAAAGRLDRATVLVRDGKIAAVGKDIVIPDDATVLDAAGGTLMPGVIDPYFEVAVAAATADAGSRTVVLRGRVLTLPGAPTRGPAYTRVADNFYPHDAGFKPLPRIGLTRLNLVTSGAGQAAVVRVTPGDPEKMLDQADGIAFISVTNATDSLDAVRTRLESAGRSARLGTRPALGSAQPAGTFLWNDVYDGKTALIAQPANVAAVLHLLKAVEPYKTVKLTLFLSGEMVPDTVAELKRAKLRVLLRP